jgi:hypothetical protein
MDASRLVTIRSFTQVVEADIARQHLESAGIRSFIRKDDQGGMQPYMHGIQGVFLEVNESEAPKADEVLKALGV